MPLTRWMKFFWVHAGCMGFIPIGFTLPVTWWRHQMETLSALLVLCERNPSVTGRLPSQKPVTRSFDVFFDLRLNKRLSKQLSAVDLRRHCAHYVVTVMTWTMVSTRLAVEQTITPKHKHDMTLFEKYIFRPTRTYSHNYYDVRSN